jgi:hypothetical protein
MVSALCEVAALACPLRLPGSARDPNMFKISTVDTRSQRRLVVEGKLSNPWVDELRSTWRNAGHDLEGRKLVIDLSSLTVISREGEDAIFDLMKQGAKFCCAGILTRHVVKAIARRCRCEPQLLSETKR